MILSSQQPVCIRNLRVLSVGVFFAGMGFSEIMPFLSLYIATLGHYSHQQLNFYSGVVFAVMYCVSAVVSPYWGKLADQKGRKPMILRASLGMAIVIATMGLVTNVWQLIALRMAQGVFAGFVSNSNALIATETPKEKSGQALGTMAAGVTGGNLLGPLLGGTLAEIFNYRVTFFITGTILFMIFLGCLLFVHEEGFQPVQDQKLERASGVIHELHSPQVIFGLLITTMIIQAANNSINPIISLFIKELMHNCKGVTFVSGVIAALPGIATMVAAPLLGRLGDQIGTQKILIAGFIVSTICFIPSAFVQNPWQLGVFRFTIGIADASLFPQVQTLLTKNSPSQLTGRIFSWNQSFMYIGNILGPLIGGLVAGLYDYRAVFLSTAFLVVINLILFIINVYHPLQTQN
ncbi:multidrug efflux MFS transporter [uncultured Limosilactobacillus sp.]|uniref:multidrug efflux MFS transporter n=1 Tax=uncultured Limosilactobacillus sp. TaxID=2837629 RepID=UPI0025DE057E|nr:multidrug efflux MFS transporter [uncultured Limosilactobacillus sp.]